jgi:aldose 1-epimerase
MKMIELNDGRANAIIAPSLGGSVLAYNVLVNGEYRAIFRESTHPQNVLDSCNFPLVPFSNRIRDGKFNWQGTPVQLPLNCLPEKHTSHGHGWQVEWDIVEINENSVLLQYSHIADDWPFPYRVMQKISLESGELTIKLSVKNTGSKIMPVGLGLHPYFTRTSSSRLTTCVDKMWAVDSECMPTKIVEPPQELTTGTGININLNKLDNAMVGFKQHAQIEWPEWGIQANMTTSDNCTFLVVYSPENENFFCVEPVTHCTDAINLFNDGREDTGLHQLAQGEEFTMWMKVAPTLIS